MSKVTTTFKDASILKSSQITELLTSINDYITKSNINEKYEKLTESFNIESGYRFYYVYLDSSTNSYITFNKGDEDLPVYSKATYILFNRSTLSKTILIPSTYKTINNKSYLYINGCSTYVYMNSSVITAYSGLYHARIDLYRTSGTNYYVDMDSLSEPLNFIDLGLPSGTLWADRNLGMPLSMKTTISKYFNSSSSSARSAIAPYLGYLYRGGETQGYHYNSYTYVTPVHDSDGIYYNGQYGTVLRSSLYDDDDAAYVSTNGVACMPTAELWKELVDTHSNSSYTWSGQGFSGGLAYWTITSNSTGLSLIMFATKCGFNPGSNSKVTSLSYEYWLKTISASHDIDAVGSDISSLYTDAYNINNGYIGYALHIWPVLKR